VRKAVREALTDWFIVFQAAAAMSSKAGAPGEANVGEHLRRRGKIGGCKNVVAHWIGRWLTIDKASVSNRQQPMCQSPAIQNLNTYQEF
jgi:hypothetical protein